MFFWWYFPTKNVLRKMLKEKRWFRLSNNCQLNMLKINSEIILTIFSNGISSIHTCSVFTMLVMLYQQKTYFGKYQRRMMIKGKTIILIQVFWRLMPNSQFTFIMTFLRGYFIIKSRMWTKHLCIFCPTKATAIWIGRQNVVYKE